MKKVSLALNALLVSLVLLAVPSVAQSAESYEERTKAAQEVAGAADLKKVMAVLGLGPDDTMGAIRVYTMLYGLARPFVIGPNEEFYGTRNKQAFAAAVDNINSAAIERAKKLIDTEDSARAFGVLLTSSSRFIFKPKEFDSTGFNAAYQHISKPIVQKTIALIGEDRQKGEQGMALTLLLQGSARFMGKDGKFDSTAFDKVFGSISADKVSAATKNGDRAAAFDGLLRP